ncbi:hypothetical protein B0H10DRAFT_1839154 [Mycena sp. CBHHK59/15]|nr:hypothetical protein B0H10DRAFT_1839154 [Mycena sp. CBHHK59/15]
MQHLHDVTEELGINNNEEQLRALTIIAEHFMFCMGDQLLLYIAGVRVACKSFVVKAVVEFFRRCGVLDRMLLSAPVLIDSYMIHALTFLPKVAKERFQDTETI